MALVMHVYKRDFITESVGNMSIMILKDTEKK